MFDQSGSILPTERQARKRLAWQLGIRATDGSVATWSDLKTFSATPSTKSPNDQSPDADAPGDGDMAALEERCLTPTLTHICYFIKARPMPSVCNGKSGCLSTESVPFPSMPSFPTSIAPALLARYRERLIRMQRCRHL